jgi:hypothetical protein
LSEEMVPPFSARDSGAHAQIDGDFPEGARFGLLHVLLDLVEREYVGGWPRVVRELERIGRVRPERFAGNIDGAEPALLALEWDKVFDFCERLYSHLTMDVYRENRETGEYELTTRRGDVQEYVSTELRRLFLEERLAVEFSGGIVRRRGRLNTVKQISRAEMVLGDPRFSVARGHFNKALRYFRNVSQPDYQNVVKDAVCAVEATARVLFPTGGSTLGEILKFITSSGENKLPKSIAKTIDGLYAFRNGGEGVSHGGATGGAVTKELAEYALALSATQIVLLVDMEIAADSGAPF